VSLWWKCCSDGKTARRHAPHIDSGADSAVIAIALETAPAIGNRIRIPFHLLHGQLRANCSFAWAPFGLEMVLIRPYVRIAS
jgi:hypothetical protein